MPQRVQSENKLDATSFGEFFQQLKDFVEAFCTNRGAIALLAYYGIEISLLLSKKDAEGK